MQRFHSCLGAAVQVVMTAACATADLSQPELRSEAPRPAQSPPGGNGTPKHFLTGSSERYPRELYITGAAKGASLADARARAFLDIGAQLTSELTSVLVTRTQTTQREGLTREATDTLEERVRFDTDGLVEVADSYAAADEVWVFAVLDRSRSKTRLLLRAERLRAEVAAAIATFDAAEKAGDISELSTLLVRARGTAREAVRLYSLSEIVGRETLAPSTWAFLADLESLDRRIHAIHAAYSVEICLNPAELLDGRPHFRRIRQDLTGWLLRAGYVVVACGTEPDMNHKHLVLEVTIVVNTPSDPALPSVALTRPTAGYQLTDEGSSRKIANGRVGGQEATGSGPDQDAASFAAARNLSALVQRDLERILGP